MAEQISRVNPLLAWLVGWGVLALLILVDVLAFDTFIDVSYIEWYVDNGALLALVTGLVFIGLNLDAVAEAGSFVALNPAMYLRDTFLLLAGVWQGWSSIFGRGGIGSKSQDPPPTRRHRLAVALVEGFDTGITTLFGAVAALLTVLWVVVVLPAQYVVFILAGAPSRTAIRSRLRTYVLATPEADGPLEIVYGESSKQEALPDGAVATGISEKPVTAAAFVAAAIMQLISSLT